MVKFKPYKIKSSQLNNLPIQEGQLIITTDTGKLYLDNDNERILFEIENDDNENNDNDINIQNQIDSLLQTMGLNIDTYNENKTYAVSDQVVYNNELYKCIEAITTPEE
jgi:sugar lactone lactonase YvrE